MSAVVAVKINLDALLSARAKNGAAVPDPAAALHRSSAPAEDSTGTMRARSELPPVQSGAEHPQVPAPLHDQDGGQPE
ncbi:MAG: hypothetical protein ABJB03_00340 [Rhodoglobus sp.]